LETLQLHYIGDASKRNVEKLGEAIQWIKSKVLKSGDRAGRVARRIYGMILKSAYGLIDVSGDGSCLFRAAVVASDSLRISTTSAMVQEIEADDLRKKCAERMRAAPEAYCNFVEVNRLTDYLKTGED